MAGELQFCLDGVENGDGHTAQGVICGWARDIGGGPVEVVVYIDEVEVAREQANTPRSDLQAAGMGECAFMIAIPAFYRDGQIHDLKVTYSNGNEIQQTDSAFLLEIISREAKAPVIESIRRHLHTSLAQDIALSIVIPTFNRADVLEKTLVSLAFARGSDPIEFVIIDDGSSDRTPDLLRVWAEKHVNFRHQSITNHGPGNARNVGAAMSQGEIVMFLGDDTRADTSRLFRAHIETHRRHPSVATAVLGKITWPSDPDNSPNYLMRLIQGAGQQQFGFKFMKPWQTYDYRFFYTSNVSVKARIVDNWLEDGFSKDFTLAAFEDAEFAYRLSKKHKEFGIFYNAEAEVKHFHSYDVAAFMRRQVACGLMLNVLLQKHPELKKEFIGEKLTEIMVGECEETNISSSALYSAVIEGLRSWIVIIERHYGLGSQNWHDDLLSGVFRMSLLDGYLSTQSMKPANQASAYRYLLEEFRENIGQAISHQAIGDLPGFGFI